MSNQQIPKELSWLAFNQRVLQEAQDETVPIVERIRFLGIYSSNMDEFFRVAVASVSRSLSLLVDEQQLNQQRQLLLSVQQQVINLQAGFEATYADLLKQLIRESIYLISELQIDERHVSWLRQYFKNHVLPYISPLMLDDQRDISHQVNHDCTYLMICFIHLRKRQYALLEIPQKPVNRFVVLPKLEDSHGYQLILIDNVIRFSLPGLFSSFFEFDQIEAYSMKLTRNAKYDLDDKFEQSQLEKIQLALRQRLTAEPVRLVYDREMPRHMLNRLKKALHISQKECLVPGGRYHNFKDFMDFPNPSKLSLEYKDEKPLTSPLFDAHKNAFLAINQQDILLHYPYQDFSYFSEMIRQAAFDPSVIFIKLTLYRVAKNSKILRSLMDAVKNDKQVTIVIELTARFDETANIEWARTLRDAGVHVHYGIASLKIHAKLCLIGRKKKQKIHLYGHVGSGNFNESTAKKYTDVSLFTANKDITNEIAGVFDLIEQPFLPIHFQHLIVSPFNTRQRLNELIDFEIQQAKLSQPAFIKIKVNNLIDSQLIEKLYQASSAGVVIDCIVRGMCALKAGVEGLSENISVISIIDRYLEHARVMIFCHAQQQLTYIGSADWMRRNIENRIEVMTPVYDEPSKQCLKTLLQLQLNDNCKARVLDSSQSNCYVSRGNKKKCRAQMATYGYLKSLGGQIES